MKLIMPVVLLIAVAFALVGCEGERGVPDENEIMSPSDAHMIPEKERALVEAAAKKGDLESVRRLIAHYEALSGSDELAEKWKATARELGDSNELYFYASSTVVAARRESDAAKRHAMLLDALEAARRSDASKANAAAQQLIREVRRQMKVEP
jgi:hypothetical protein